MSKLSSKLCRNENNIEISFYQIYLPKLHENILKYSRLSLFKEIAIGFTYGLQTTSESLQVFPKVSLFELINAVILDFSSSLVLLNVLLISQFNHVPHTMIKGITIQGV